MANKNVLAAKKGQGGGHAMRRQRTPLTQNPPANNEARKHVKVANAPAAVTLVPHELARSARLFAVFPLDLASALSCARPRGDTSIHAGDVWPRTHSE